MGGGGSFESAFEQQTTIDEINTLKKKETKSSVFKETPDVN